MSGYCVLTLLLALSQFLNKITQLNLFKGAHYIGNAEQTIPSQWNVSVHSALSNYQIEVKSVLYIRRKLERRMGFAAHSTVPKTHISRMSSFYVHLASVKNESIHAHHLNMLQSRLTEQYKAWRVSYIMKQSITTPRVRDMTRRRVC